MNIGCSTSDEAWQAVTAAMEKQRREGGFSLGVSKPAAIITSERYEDLWQAVLAKCEELKQQHKPVLGDGRSSALTDWDGRGTSVLLTLSQDDGTDLIYRVQARERARQRTIEVTCDGPWLNAHDQFWAKEAADRSDAVVIGHNHYRVHPDLAAGTPRYCAGFGGALHRIRMLATGEVTETRNLWHQGVIPPSWRDRLPDDAEFVTAEQANAPEPNPYEAACERFNAASARYPEALREADRLCSEADAEYEAAQANLRQYESQPGIPLPEYREQVSSS